MIRIRSGRFGAARDRSCPSPRQLSDLLEGRLSDAQQAELIGHLDTCVQCRDTLEESAGGQELWRATARHLRAARPDSGPEFERLMARLRSSCDPLHSGPTSERDELSFSFLAPCEKPGRIGRLDRYEIVEVIGHGGMGVVFKAFDPSLERMVAVKVLAWPPATREKARKRFLREARAAAAVRSQHVVSVYAVEETAEVPYLVMEYVEGISLQQRLDRGDRLSVEEIVRIGAQTAAGLAAAHAQGLVHRDVKPANILLDKGTGAVKITDFGLACAVDEAGLGQSRHIAGTPEYMAPEQADGGPVDHRADLFSLGSVIYAMCTGRPPFLADSPMTVLAEIRNRAPRPVHESRPDTPEWLAAAIDKLHSKDPSQRYGSAAEVFELLAQHIDDGRARSATLRSRAAGANAGAKRPPRRRWLVAAAVLVLTAGFGVSELAGFTRVVSLAATALNVGAPAAEDPAQPAGGVPLPEPVRVRVLPRDALLREAIQAEKDGLAEEPSPFLVRKFEGHAGPVSGVAFSPDGKTILSCSGWPKGDRTVRLWDVASGEEVRRFQTAAMPKNPGISGSREAPGEFFCLAFALDGKQAITGSTGGSVCVWDVDSGTIVRRFQGHSGTVYGIAVSPDGRRVLSGGRGMTARLWDIQTGRELLRLPCHNSWIRSVAISADGWSGLTGSYDNTVRLWDLETGEELRKLKANDHWVWSVKFSPTGRRAVSASGNLIHLWDLKEGKVLRRYKGHLSAVTCVAFSPDGKHLLSASYDGSVRLWEVETGKELRVFTGHREWVWSVAFSPDGGLAVSGGGGLHSATGDVTPGSDFAIRLWKLP